MILLDGAAAALLGFGLGAVTGMPIGVVNVAIADAAARGEKRYATGVGIGGALADTVHAGLAFVGVGHLVTMHPRVMQVMAVAAALAISAYALFGARRIPAVKPKRASGIAAGLLLTLPNPAPLTAWVAIAAAVWPHIARGPALILAAGVGIGSATWFTLLAHWIAALPRDSRVRRTLPSVAAVLLVCVAVAGAVRAFL